MLVFKFGGASVKDAEAVKNVAQIVGRYASGNKLIIVISAMGKITNALESLYSTYRVNGDYMAQILEIKEFHLNISRNLFPESDDYIETLLERQFDKLQALLEAQAKTEQYDEGYDQIISFGEVISTYIVNHYLQTVGISSYWVDARQYIQTDNTWREGKVDWTWTEKIIQKQIPPLLSHSVVVTQGFIGGTVDNKTTTLGREGSDYTASIFAHCLNAESLTIWKDVPGIMNADPKRLPNAVLFSELGYNDAAEMTYYGATVIHPKTIRPLANRNIPLLVRSFLNWEADGTIIGKSNPKNLPSTFIFKDNQRLISLHTRNYSFITESDLVGILEQFIRYGQKINLIQISALSISISVDNNASKTDLLIESLKSGFEILYNSGLTLITVKNHNKEAIESVCSNRKLILEQKTRNTWQALVE